MLESEPDCTCNRRSGTRTRSPASASSCAAPNPRTSASFGTTCAPGRERSDRGAADVQAGTGPDSDPTPRRMDRGPPFLHDAGILVLGADNRPSPHTRAARTTSSTSPAHSRPAHGILGHLQRRRAHPGHHAHHMVRTSHWCPSCRRRSRCASQDRESSTSGRRRMRLPISGPWPQLPPARLIR